MLLRRTVAVKVLRPDYAHDPARLQRFAEAVRQAAAVSHRSVARVYDHGGGDADGPPYLVSEFIDGPSLAEVISTETARASFIAAAVAQVADGLHAAHQAGLLHGDLKPANIVLAPGAARRATITDFGITHALGAIPRAGLTPGTTHGTGTVLYLAPERVSGGLGTPASDLYSLGIIACEWLTGIAPFTGTSQQVLAAHLRQPLPRLPAAVPAGLAELVARLAAKEPRDRFCDACEVAAVARALATELREGASDEVTCFPARPKEGAGLSRHPATGGGAVAAAPRPADKPAGFRLSGLAAHKREIAWAASALILAGLMGWAPSAPVHSAVRIVQLAGNRPVVARHPDADPPPPGHGDGRHPAAGNADISRSARPGASGPGSAAEPGAGHDGAGPGGSSFQASGRPDRANGGRLVGSRSSSPSPAPSRPPGTGPQGPGPYEPTSSPPSPSAPATSPSRPAPSTGAPQPPDAPPSLLPAWPVPVPPAPLPVPTLLVSIPPFTAPSAALPSSILGS